jgi:hypothetical protein
MPPILQPSSPRRQSTRSSGSSLASFPSVKDSERPGISRDTAIMPWIVADKICEEAANYLHSPVPLRYKEHLDAKAERCYARHRQFRKLIRARGNAGRDSLYSFMRHWLYALLHKNHPDLARRLPESFAVGRPLPLPSEVKSPGNWFDVYMQCPASFNLPPRRKQAYRRKRL